MGKLLTSTGIKCTITTKETKDQKEEESDESVIEPKRYSTVPWVHLPAHSKDRLDCEVVRIRQEAIENLHRVATTDLKALQMYLHLDKFPLPLVRKMIEEPHKHKRARDQFQAPEGAQVALATQIMRALEALLPGTHTEAWKKHRFLKRGAKKFNPTLQRCYHNSICLFAHRPSALYILPKLFQESNILPLIEESAMWVEKTKKTGLGIRIRVKPNELENVKTILSGWGCQTWSREVLFRDWYVFVLDKELAPVFERVKAIEPPSIKGPGMEFIPNPESCQVMSNPNTRPVMSNLDSCFWTEQDLATLKDARRLNRACRRAEKRTTKRLQREFRERTSHNNAVMLHTVHAVLEHDRRSRFNAWQRTQMLALRQQLLAREQAQRAFQHPVSTPPHQPSRRVIRHPPGF